MFQYYDRSKCGVELFPFEKDRLSKLGAVDYERRSFRVGRVLDGRDVRSGVVL